MKTKKRRTATRRRDRALSAALTMVMPFLRASDCPPFGFGSDEEFFRCIDRVANEHFGAKQRDREFTAALRGALPAFAERDVIQTLANDRITPAARGAYVFGLAVGLRMAALWKEARYGR